MKQVVIEHLANTRLSSLAAGLAGVASVLVGVLLLVSHRQLRVFATAMIVLGGLETGFLLSYFRSDPPAESTTVTAFDLDREAARRSEVAALRKQLGQLFWVRIAYAALILFCVLSLSKLALGPTLQGLSLALVIHASCAITIDNFIERTCQRTLRALEHDPSAS
jgi:hypothetical protein